MKLWVKVGQSESTKVDYRDGEDVDDLKKTIKTAMSPVFNEVAVADIIIRRQQGVEFLAPGVLLKDILAAGHGNTAEQPILVDAPAPAGKNVIKALPWLSTALATLVPIPFSQQFIDTILSHPVAHILSTLAEFYTTQRLGAAVPAAGMCLLRHTNLLSTHFPLNVPPHFFLCCMNPCAPYLMSDLQCDQV